MAIYTEQGVKVRIIGLLSDHTGIADGMVRVQDIDFPTWIRGYETWRLRADGGPKEVEAAICSAPKVVVR